MVYTFTSNKLATTKKVAKFLKKNLKKNELILLKGDLGAGKTTFTKFLLKILGVRDIVSSPTFTIVKNYKGKDLNIFHFDLYRLNDETELVELNFFEIVNNITDKQLVIIEWPEIAMSYIKRPFITINVKFDEDKRIYEVNLDNE